MSPSAEPAHVAVEADSALATRLLEDGELILLAVKPSRWFVLLASWPVLLLAAGVAVATVVAGRFYSTYVEEPMMVLVCAAVACTRLTVACLQWQGRLYLLTNRRVMRLRGVFREDVFQCPLKHLVATHLSETLPERMVGIGSLLLDFDPPCHGDGHWLHLAQPREAQQAIEEARRRAR